MGAFGDSLANVYSDNVQAATSLRNNKDTIKQRGRESFIDALNSGLKIAAGLKTADADRKAAAALQEQQDAAALDRGVKLEDLKNKHSIEAIKAATVAAREEQNRKDASLSEFNKFLFDAQKNKMDLSKGQGKLLLEQRLRTLDPKIASQMYEDELSNLPGLSQEGVLTSDPLNPSQVPEASFSEPTIEDLIDSEALFNDKAFVDSLASKSKGTTAKAKFEETKYGQFQKIAEAFDTPSTRGVAVDLDGVAASTPVTPIGNSILTTGKNIFLANPTKWSEARSNLAASSGNLKDLVRFSKTIIDATMNTPDLDTFNIKSDLFTTLGDKLDINSLEELGRKFQFNSDTNPQAATEATKAYKGLFGRMTSYARALADEKGNISDTDIRNQVKQLAEAGQTGRLNAGLMIQFADGILTKLADKNYQFLNNAEHNKLVNELNELRKMEGMSEYTPGDGGGEKVGESILDVAPNMQQGFKATKGSRSGASFSDLFKDDK